ncbi:DUF1573 domain-containing protein [Candidatus Daviesbacteria bacterium]|nr:DUF1573 domain-containing protein [Candidatus Daviesbacteria bacterium]
MNNPKIIIGVVITTVLLLIGAVFLLSSAPTKPKLEKTNGVKLQVLENSFDFKNIPFGGGLAIHSYAIKNIGDKDLQIANLATSCTCTKTYGKTPAGAGPKSSMKGMSQSSGWVGTLKPGESGEVVAEFDPTFHGPSGVGPISRNISFETNDPDNPYVELSFSGTVVK